MSETLAHTTVVNYRSRLKLLKEVMSKLSETEQVKAKAEIDKLERQLGPFVQAERKPGRPKSRTEIPDNAKPTDVRTATKWSEAAKLERLKAKQARLKASLIEVNGELEEKEESKSEFDKANEAIQEAMNAEKTHGGAHETERGNGRTGGEGERGIGEEVKGEGR